MSPYGAFFFHYSYCPLPFIEAVETQVGSLSSGRISNDPSVAAGASETLRGASKRGGKRRSYSLWRWQQLLEDQAPTLQAFP